MLLFEERQQIVEYGRKMLSSGLVKGSGGNISLCNPGKTLLAITPTGITYDEMRPEDVVVMDLDGGQAEGFLKPSSEIAFHLALIKLRPDINAVVHTHSEYATTMACLRLELPPVHYLVGYAGFQVPVAPYATFGTQALSENVCKTMGNGNAVLMANHGVVAVGYDLKSAYTTADMVEYVSKIYLQAKAVGAPYILDEKEMELIIEKFKTYGKQ